MMSFINYSYEKYFPLAAIGINKEGMSLCCG